MGLEQRRAVSAVAAEPFMNGTSSIYIEDMYRAWRQDPASVHKVSPIFTFTFPQSLPSRAASRVLFLSNIRVLSCSFR